MPCALTNSKLPFEFSGHRQSVRNEGGEPRSESARTSQERQCDEDKINAMMGHRQSYQAEAPHAEWYIPVHFASSSFVSDSLPCLEIHMHGTFLASPGSSTEIEFAREKLQ